LLPDIDPVEIALAVIGVRPIISKTVERVKAAQFDAMDRLPKRITELARQLCAGTLEELHFGDLSYTATLRDLSEEYDAGQVEKMVARFPDDHSDLAAAFVLKAKDVSVFLRGIFPITTTTSVSGFRNIRPPDIDVRKFVIVLDAVDDPLRVFGWMAAGALLKRQVAAVRAIYPTLGKAIDAAIDEAILDARTDKKSFELPVHTERGVNVWHGRPPIDPKLASALQAGYRKADAERAEPRQPSGGNTSALAKEAMTSAQKSLYPDALRSGPR
jgi:hypothetical protein